MFVLFETAAGFAIFKLKNESKLEQAENLFRDFETPERARKILSLVNFSKFDTMEESLNAMRKISKGELCKPLSKFLKEVVGKDSNEELAVADATLGKKIREKLNINCVSNSSIAELMRCVRTQADAYFGSKERTSMALGLAHSLSRYKLQFSSDKIDTMVIQAVSLLDDLDKELNNYVMRCKEWYGWHFPELSKIVTDNIAYVKLIKAAGKRQGMVDSEELEEILPEEKVPEVRQAASISMGTDIADDDIEHIHDLCTQILEMTDYRTQLSEYLSNKMMAIAPNLSVLVGEVVAARLISHAGSTRELAKKPASTVQVLGAEKALFRALKTRKDTPKFGLLYHSNLVGQSSAKNKGKMARMLAAKAALAVRLDALGKEGDTETELLGVEHRAKLESRLRFLEEGGIRKRISGVGRNSAKFDKYQNVSNVVQYPSAVDNTITPTQKRPREDGENDAELESKPKKKKKSISVEENGEEEKTPKSKKKSKVKQEAVEEGDIVKTEEEGKTPKAKKRASKALQDEDAMEGVSVKTEAGGKTPKSKKRASKVLADEVAPEAGNEEQEPEKSPKKKKKKKSKQSEEA